MIVHIIKQRLIEENRERKIESILEDKPFVPYTEEMAMSDITDDFCNQLKIALKSAGAEDYANLAGEIIQKMEIPVK